MLSYPIHSRFTARIPALFLTLFSSVQAATTPTTPGGPTVSVNQPVAVTVTGPVEVQGTVEVLNDALRTPFSRVVTGSFLDTSSSAGAGFPIPAGKRLIIKNVSLHVSVPFAAEQAVIGSLYVAASGTGSNTSPHSFNLSLSLLAQGKFGDRARFVGTHSVDIIVDPRIHAGITFGAERAHTVGAGVISATLVGYLEELSAVSPATP
jgi:hypothetical protein